MPSEGIHESLESMRSIQQEQFLKFTCDFGHLCDLYDRTALNALHALHALCPLPGLEPLHGVQPLADALLHLVHLPPPHAVDPRDPRGIHHGLARVATGLRCQGGQFNLGKCVVVYQTSKQKEVSLKLLLNYVPMDTNTECHLIIT